MVSVEVISDNSRRSVLAVSRTEGVVYIAISVRSQCLGEFLLASLHLLLGSLVVRIILLDANRLAFLFRIEAEVFEQEDFTRLQRSSLFASLSAVRSELNGNAELFRNSIHDLAEGELRVHLAFGLAHVRHDD